MPARVDSTRAWPLHDVATTRRIEADAAAHLPPHTLMQRAGLATARLALALAPHARTVWLACGPGNNGGDGLEAALHLQRWGKQPVVSWLGDPLQAPPDAQAAWHRACAAGVRFAEAAPELTPLDLAVDALLGIGNTRPLSGRMADAAAQLAAGPAPVLSLDLPSGLHGDTGQFAPDSGASTPDSTRTDARFHARHTLALLTLKPGLFTGDGRAAAGQVWFDDLGAGEQADRATAWLSGAPPPRARGHAGHKGSFGEVAVIGGDTGMTGAAVLAASAALHAGAGRVYVGLLGDGPAFDAGQPELMFRPPNDLPLATATLVCGCGGGDVVRTVLPQVLGAPVRVVLDADALNAIANDPMLRQLLAARGARGRVTVLTPHPLEAARLLGRSTADVQRDRIAAAQALAGEFGAIVVLKGSGSVIAAPGEWPRLNASGNARLATAGTGDVLAGQIGAALADHTDARTPFAITVDAVFRHGRLADAWPAGTPLVAGALARA